MSRVNENERLEGIIAVEREQAALGVLLTLDADAA